MMTMIHDLIKYANLVHVAPNGSKLNEIQQSLPIQIIDGRQYVVLPSSNQICEVSQAPIASALPISSYNPSTTAPRTEDILFIILTISISTKINQRSSNNTSIRTNPL